MSGFISVRKFYKSLPSSILLREDGTTVKEFSVRVLLSKRRAIHRFNNSDKIKMLFEVYSEGKLQRAKKNTEPTGL